MGNGESLHNKKIHRGFPSHDTARLIWVRIAIIGKWGIEPSDYINLGAS